MLLEIHKINYKNVLNQLIFAVIYFNVMHKLNTNLRV